jgi:hypothetical protein
MSFNGNEGTQITQNEGRTLTKAYRDSNPGARKALFYGKNKIQAILNQTGCMGLRIYFGEDTAGNPELVIVGADSSEKDMLSYVLDKGVPCPNCCDTTSVLNS